jgi:hypothetical protein
MLSKIIQALDSMVEKISQGEWRIEEADQHMRVGAADVEICEHDLHSFPCQNESEVDRNHTFPDPALSRRDRNHTRH